MKAQIKEEPDLKNLLKELGTRLKNQEIQVPIPFEDFLKMAKDKPELIFRDIFQLFYDMVYFYVGKTHQKSENGSLGLNNYNLSDLFVKDCDNPFFSDRLFANRFLKLTDGFKKGIQSNNIFLFEGPPGSGKSTFLNNLLQKFENYTKTPEGTVYETFWRLDVQKLGGFQSYEKMVGQFTDKENWEEDEEDDDENKETKLFYSYLNASLDNRSQKFVEFSCPNHDHPVLQIPKHYRADFLDGMISNKEFKKKLFHDKEYEWVFKQIPCSICASLFTHLLNILGDPLEVLKMVFARQELFSRQYGEGVSVFNPSDPIYQGFITSPTIQRMLNELLKNDKVAYIHSNLARTNNGILALMDIKEHNIKRLMKLHGIISDSVHKVELIEERVKALFVGLVNPADKLHYENIPSFKDRIITVNIPYVLDYKTEVRIYKNKFGEKIESHFLPQVLDNVAKIIVATRLNDDSPAINHWIDNPDKYGEYLDENYLLLKMEIYAGKIPNWLSEEDAKRFDRKIQKSILTESETEGNKGFSGRQSLNVFNAFYTKYVKTNKLITMDMVNAFFEKQDKIEVEIPEGFVKSLTDLYDYNVLQEVKESMYSYNRDNISKDIQNYLFSINFEPGETKVSQYTGDSIEITEEYFKKIETIMLGSDCTTRERKLFRQDVHQEYVTITLSQEIRIEGKNLTESHQYKKLFERYTQNLKENSLVAYLNNDNFRRAILEYGTGNFNSYDKRIRQDVSLLINNLQGKFKYSEEGAKQVSLYVLDKDLALKFV